VIGNSPVTEITVDKGEITGVTTPHGSISTPRVIDAAGAWARAVGALAGVEVPVAPVRHQLLITRPIAGMSPSEPIARIVDASAYLRPARGGLMMGGMEHDPFAIDPRLDPTFEMSQTPLDMRVLDLFVEALGPLTPALGDTPVAEHRGGLFTMTPDARFLAGPVPGVRGLWTATGCNGSGFSISAGIGRALAEWIIGGEPPFDLSSLDPGRFGPGPFNDEELTNAGLYRYANYYTPGHAG
jgi:glycine/D-amino acid oxidase-like deaminating enzyme